MTTVTGGFETGVNGNSILTSDGGDADAWQTAGDDTGGARTYDNTHVYDGSLAAKVVAGTASGAGFGWTTAGGINTATDHYGRAYLYATANPSTSHPIIQCSGIGDRRARIDLTPAGRIRLIDAPASGDQTGSVSISLNQWVRLEWHIVHSATVGMIEVRLFNTADASTPSETITSPATWNTGTAAGGIYFGNPQTGTSGYTMWWDAVVAGAASYPGPVVTAAPDLLSMQSHVFGHNMW